MELFESRLSDWEVSGQKQDMGSGTEHYIFWGSEITFWLIVWAQGSVCFRFGIGISV